MLRLPKTVFVATLLAGLSFVLPSAVSADQSATQNSTITVTCTSGSYGQSNNCYAINNQSITQNQYVSRTGLYKHIPVAASIDVTLVTTLIALAVLASAGAVSTRVFKS